MSWPVFGVTNRNNSALANLPEWICSADNVNDRPTNDLLRLFFPRFIGLPLPSIHLSPSWERHKCWVFGLVIGASPNFEATVLAAGTRFRTKKILLLGPCTHSYICIRAFAKKKKKGNQIRIQDVNTLWCSSEILFCCRLSGAMTGKQVLDSGFRLERFGDLRAVYFRYG